MIPAVVDAHVFNCHRPPPNGTALLRRTRQHHPIGDAYQNIGESGRGPVRAGGETVDGLRQNGGDGPRAEASICRRWSCFPPPKDTEEGTAVLLKPPQQRPAGDLLRASDVEPSVEHTRAHRPTQGGQRARQTPRCGRSRPRAAAVDCIAGQGAVVLRGCSDRVTPTCINRRYVTPAIAASAGPVGRGRRWRGVVSMLVGGGLGATGRFARRGVG